VINQEAESSEGEETLCSENAALVIAVPHALGMGSAPALWLGSCRCLVVTEGCLPSWPCQSEGIHRQNVDWGVPKSSAGWDSSAWRIF